MIFVTVGNAQQGFGRLLEAVDRLAAQGFFEGEAVFMQTGHTGGFQPQASQWRPFLSLEEFRTQLEAASLVICHGGCTVLEALRLGKVPVVMPRRRRYGEHVNDHQVQFTKALAAEGRIAPAYEPVDLEDAVRQARRTARDRRRLETVSPMANLVEKAIEELIGPAAQDGSIKKAA